MNLAEIQRSMFDVVREPLTPAERTRRRIRDGRSTRQIANAVIKPNDRLTSLERLEIYNRQYWFRILSAFQDDFPGLRAILGPKRFEKLAVAYLADCPSRSYTLRNLGSRLEAWLREHMEYVAGVEQFAMDMVQLEWAEIEAFDLEAKPVLGEADLARLGPDPRFLLQPYLRFLVLSFPAHKWLLKVRKRESGNEVASNAASERHSASRWRRPRLPAQVPTYLAVHRVDHSVYFKILEPDAYALLLSLRRGDSLSVALDALAREPQLSEEAVQQVHNWFSNWARLGWFCKECE